MITKEEALQYIRNIAEQKIITKEEVSAAYDSGNQPVVHHEISRKLGISEILYYIGGAIVFLGIAILIFQNWDSLNFATRLLATLGGAIAAYVVGLLFDRDKKTENISPAFYLIFALVAPIGLYVVFDNAGADVGSYGMQSLISCILFISCFLSATLLRKNIFNLFTVIFGTWLFFAITSLVGYPYLDESKFYLYRFLVAGLSYIFLGYAFSKNEKFPLSGFLYGFGIFGFLVSALSLGGWSPEQNVFWEIIFPILAFGTIFISVQIKSKSFLTWGTFFLMAYIIKITSEYFSDSLGWPLTLVIAGLALIVVGYVSISIKNKYLSASFN